MEDAAGGIAVAPVDSRLEIGDSGIRFLGIGGKGLIIVHVSEIPHVAQSEVLRGRVLGALFGMIVVRFTWWSS